MRESQFPAIWKVKSQRWTMVMPHRDTNYRKLVNLCPVKKNFPIFRPLHVRSLTFIGIHMNLDMLTLTCTLIFSGWFFKYRNIFLVLIILYCSKTYCNIVDFWFSCLSLEERFFTVYIYFKETLFFNFSYKLFNKYFSLSHRTLAANLECRKKIS